MAVTAFTTIDIEQPSDDGIQRPNRLEVDLGAIRNNTQIVKRLLDPGTTLFGAVKSNGYGLGLPAVATAMQAGGADGFTVTDPADAIRIRQAGVEAPILLYGGILPSPATVAALHRLDLMCTVPDVETAQAFSVLNASRPPLPVFAKIDIGLERLGTYAEQGLDFVRAMASLTGIRLAGIYSHIHGSESTAYRAWQLDRFGRLLRELETARIEIPLRMSESSASLGLQDAYSTNAVDPGHLLYGLAPSGRAALPSGLKPAPRRLTSRIIQVKDFRRDEFRAESPVPVGSVRRIGVIPIGRGDGLQHLTAGHVVVRGQLAPITGRLSLEHARLDLTAIPGCTVGDEVEIISWQPDTEISAGNVAAANQLDLVGLQIAIAPSIPRAYLDAEQA